MAHCRYYFQEEYESSRRGTYQCDEYPFASTLQGAAADRINYSVRAVYASHNDLHGRALKAFYGHYRLLYYDPNNTPTKTSDSPFWVKIAN